MPLAKGHSYEREAIEAWFGSDKNTSPMTGAVLSDLTLAPNHALRSAIEEYVDGLAAAEPASRRSGKPSAQDAAASGDRASGSGGGACDGDGGGGGAGAGVGLGADDDDDDDVVSVLDRAHARQLAGVNVGGGATAGRHGGDPVGLVERWLQAKVHVHIKTGLAC